MAGFGAAGKGKASKAKSKSKAKPAPAAKLSPKRQWDIHRELVKAGQEAAYVFARLPDDDASWIPMGEVSAEAPGTKEQAAQLHKRLILEHTVRCKPTLMPRSRELICGVAESADAEPVPLQKCEVPQNLRAGYAGTPDTASGYYVTYNAASDAFTGTSKKLGMGGF